MTRINQSWREQAKAVVGVDENNKGHPYRSVWEAATEVSREYGCAFGTARKEIRKAIRLGVRRYGRVWRYCSADDRREQ